MKSLSIIAALALTSVIPAVATAKAAAPEARLAKLLEGRVAGKPVRCLSTFNTQSVEVIDGTALVYRSGKRLYVNRTRSPEQLDRDDILVTRQFGSQLCEMDIVRLVSRAGYFPRGFVGLTEFVPYVKSR